MPPYRHFAKFYDATMGNRAPTAKLLHGLIQKNAPQTRTLLELACGTGGVLLHLSAYYEVAGLDLSPHMLHIARAKLPRTAFHHADMTSFDIGKRFDAIVCVYDSINHLLQFRAWKQVFRNARRHLLKDGIFIFDINTHHKLQHHLHQAPWVKQLGNDTLVMSVTELARGVTNWNIKVFEQQGGKRYRLHEEDIRETSFSIHRIMKSLFRYFDNVRVIDPNRSRPSQKSYRLYFVCSDHRSHVRRPS
jgi:SAM-dependent methyltransferase